MGDICIGKKNSFSQTLIKGKKLKFLKYESSGFLRRQQKFGVRGRSKLRLQEEGGMWTKKAKSCKRSL